MTITKPTLLFLSFVLISLISKGQVIAERQKLMQFSKISQVEFNQKKAFSKKYAQQLGLPLIIDTDSSFMELMYIDDANQPQYFTTTNKNSTKTISTNKVHPGGGSGFNLDGSGLQVHQWDAGAVLSSHQEFGNRVTQGDGAALSHYHSTHVAGTLIASGVVSNAKGMVPGAGLKAFDWNNDNAEMATEAASGALISNHSYGFVRGWYNGVWYGDQFISTSEDYHFGFYNIWSETWDYIAYNAPYYLIVKSAGNDRNNCGDGSFPCDGPYDCISDKGVAKNIMTVGAVHDIPSGYTEPMDVIMTSFSSWGPADDGRIKPDVVANGKSLYSTNNENNYSYNTLSGTSMSSPSVAGSLLLLQQHYQNLHGSGQFMKAATIKALVIHTADETGSYPGPDYQYGWGLMNTLKAAQLISCENGNDTIIEELTLNEGEVYQINYTTSSPQPIQVTVVWTDPPGNPPPPSLDPPDPMLVNDLDLLVTQSSNTYFPWKMNVNIPSDPATNLSTNDVDNVEQVLITKSKINVNYTITVTHKGSLEGGSQDFSIVVSPVTKPVYPVQPPEISWSKVYGGFNNDVPGVILETADGGYIVGGEDQCSDGHFPEKLGSSGYDCIIAKLTNEGEISWTKTIGGSADEQLSMMQITSDGGYILAVRTFSTDGDVNGNKGDADIWIVKLDASGNIIWSKTYGGTLGDWPQYIQQKKDGGFIVVGTTWSDDGDVTFNHGDADYWVLNLDADGNLIWAKTYGGSSGDIASSVVQSNNGQFVVAGYSYSNNGDVPGNNGNSDIWVFKLDADGNLLWTKNYGGSNADGVWDDNLYKTCEGGYIIAGHSWSDDGDVGRNYGESDFWILKLDEQGEKTWSKNYGGIRNDIARSIQQTTDKGFVIAGYSWSSNRDVPNNSGDEDFLIVKIDEDGNKKWCKSIGGTASDRPYFVRQTSDHGYILTGHSRSSNNDVPQNFGSADFLIIKLDTDENNPPDPLPFYEDWEHLNGNITTDQIINNNENCIWTFETDHQNEGRARWGTDAHIAHSGDGALTLDRYPLGEQVKNKAILTLNLSNYTESENLWLSFAWSDEREQNDAGDRVWVRGSETDEWVMIYNINPLSGINGKFNHVSGLDIDATLAAADPPQTVCETFQVCFGQEGLYFGLWGGITFDDIAVYEDTPCGKLTPVQLPFVEDFETTSAVSRITETIQCTDDHTWSYYTSLNGEGRSKWGTESYISHSGEGALSLDRHPGGEAVMNKATLTLNMQDYIGSEDLWMDFAWADHRDQDEAGDNVWIRGSIYDEWLVIYNINPMSGVDDRFNYVSRLDIDAVLADANPPQELSETFQLRFGQEGSLPIYWDGITFDDISIYEYSPCGLLDQVTLPFYEDWEDYTGTSAINQLMACGNDYYWQLDTDHPLEGRARWGEDAFSYYEGVGAITLDRYPAGEKTKNTATLTLNLEDYMASEDLWLSFAWTDNNDGEDAGDEVWVRGSLDDEWVRIYNINPLSGVNGEYTYVENLDIDATMAAANPAQVVGKHFQLRFGQEGRYFNQWGGITFDNILIEEDANKAEKANIETFESDFNIYADKDHIYVRSYGDAVFEEKQLVVYDLFGRTVINQLLAPGSLSKIPVVPCSCYLIVKVMGDQHLKVEKVFVR